MRITFQHDKAVRASSELLNLSRLVRQTGYETEDVRRELRRQDLFEECERELKRQEETLYRLTAYLVSLSAALDEIADLYSRAEVRNVERLDGGSSLYQNPGTGTLYQNTGEIHILMERILHP